MPIKKPALTIITGSLSKPFNYRLYDLSVVLNLSERNEEGIILAVMLCLFIKCYRMISVANLVQTLFYRGKERLISPFKTELLPAD